MHRTCALSFSLVTEQRHLHPLKARMILGTMWPNVFQLTTAGSMHKYNILNGQQTGLSSRTGMSSNHFIN